MTQNRPISPDWGNQAAFEGKSGKSVKNRRLISLFFRMLVSNILNVVLVNSLIFCQTEIEHRSNSLQYQKSPLFLDIVAHCCSKGQGGEDGQGPPGDVRRLGDGHSVSGEVV